MNKAKIDLNDNLILRSENVEYNNDTLKNYLGTIIESGGNSNGNYIKYTNGTMICYGSNKASSPKTITFPHPFITDNPIITADVITPNVIASSAPKIVIIGNKTSTSFKAYCVYYMGSAGWDAAGENFDWQAIGEWK